MQRLLVALLICATLIASTGATLLAHEGHDHKVMGTVTAAAANHIVVKDKAGKSVTIQVTSETRIKATPALKAEQLKPGTRVVVTALENKDKTMRAKVVEVGAVPAAAK